MEMSLDDLEKAVAKMRALGVRKWGVIELDDPPAPAPKEGEDKPGNDDTADHWPDPYSQVPHLKKFDDTR